MGDRRFDGVYDALHRARDRAAAIAALDDEEVVQALAAASGKMDAYLANVLAVEVLNRQRRQRARLYAISTGLGFAILARSFLIVKASTGIETAFDRSLLVTSIAVLVPSALAGLAVYLWLARRPRR